MAVNLSGLNFFIHILSFLLVWIVVYAVLAKTKILGEAKFLHWFVSLILAILFIAKASLMEFVNFSTAWFAV